MDKLVQGLVKLSKADPAIETYSNENGEVVIETSGEIH
jgi:translation elongation factor EF-G